MGRVINRLSSDMYTVDDSLPFMLNIFLAQASSLVAIVAVSCFAVPMFTVVLVPLSLVYFFIQVSNFSLFKL